MAKKAVKLIGERLEKRDIKIDGKCKTIRIRPSIWEKFNELATLQGKTISQLGKIARTKSNASLADGIEALVREHFDTLYDFATREQWLLALVEQFKPEFAARGCPIERPIRVSIGFTSKGARSKAIGECWPSHASKDAVNEIFISPYIEDATKLAGILAHEMIHAWDDCKNGHKAPFKRGQAAIGLEGKATECVDGAQWRAWALPLVEAVGPVPHASLSRLDSKKKQTTRMLKIKCECCDFTFRAAKASIETACTLDEAELPYLVCPSPVCQTRIYPFNAGDGLTDADKVDTGSE